MDDNTVYKKPLPPLKGESPTGFYKANGHPITEEDKKYFENRGVVFKAGEGGDLLPDGIRLKPRRIRSDRRASSARWRKSLRISATPDGLEEIISGLQKEYAKLDPANRPPFSEWIVSSPENDKMLTMQLIRMAFASGNPNLSLRALGLLWEFGKVKPKTQMELSDKTAAPTMAMTPEELLDLALEANGYDPKKGVAAIRSSGLGNKLVQ